jgi:hypothetical protein
VTKSDPGRIAFQPPAFSYISAMAQRENTDPNPPANTAGEAVWPGKEAWKNEPGNRYTPEELRDMERNWKIEVFDPSVVEVHHVD